MVRSMSDPTPPPQIPAPSGSNPPSGSGSGSNEKQWAIFIHLSALAVFLGFLPALNVLGPLLIWLFKRAESPYLDAVGKRVLNFQISYFIYVWSLGVVIFVLSFILIGLLLVPVLILLGIAWLILTIMGAIKESDGTAFKFPLVIEFLK